MSNEVCDSCGGALDARTGICVACATQVQPSTASRGVTTPGAESRRNGETLEIPGYRILRALGEGGMGAVYLAEETTLGRRVAIKVISGPVGDPQSKARFLREARTLATVEHPHVVRVYSFGEVDGRPYLAMEYVEGETLAERIEAGGRLPLDAALRVARDVVEALEAAWERKVVHRDIKPSNILIDTRNRVRVADFGLAKGALWDSDASLTASGLLVGTPHYISPEQAQGRDTDFRADFYSLGIVLYHVLTGERPFAGSTPVAIVARHLHDSMPLLRSVRSDIPEEVDRLVQRLTQKDPAMRPASHAELLAALDALIAGSAAADEKKATLPREARRGGGHRIWRAAAAAALLSILAVMAYLAAGRFDDESRPAAATPARQPFVVAVAPFYGPDPDSAKEGRVMAALIERAVAQKLAAPAARVLGIEETRSAVRSHDEARQLGVKLAADAVIWGEAFALRRETEIQPHVTRVEIARATSRSESTDGVAGPRLPPDARAANAIEGLRDAGGGVLKLHAEAPNQIELRKTSASGVGDVVLLLAGIHVLEKNGDPATALRLVRAAPRTADTMRYEVQALLKLDRSEEARKVLAQVLAVVPGDAPSHALMGDLTLASGLIGEAAAAYRRAAALGVPYTTARGIWFAGKLYVKETYRNPRYYSGTETDSLFLIAIDPSSGKVVERHPMPGSIESFRIDADSLVIRYNAGQDDRRLDRELRLLGGGKFDRPLWPPPNLAWRMRATRSARFAPSNFITDLEAVRATGDSGGRFRLASADELVPGAPRTLPDLENVLRANAEHDPTQPWHLFFLALTLRHQNRYADAEGVLDEMVRREYPGIPYFHYSWMLNFCERLRLDGWSDKIYPKLLAERRRLPQPITFSTLVERLINGTFARHAALNRSGERGYVILRRAREVTGVAPEGEDLIAGLWARYFDMKGAAAAAAHERGVVRAIHAHPFNYLRAAAEIDYALVAALAALLAYSTLFCCVLAEALGRVRRQRRASPAGAFSREERHPSHVRRIASLIALAVVLGAPLLVTLALRLEAHLVAAAVVLASVIAVYLLVRAAAITPPSVIRAVSGRERLWLAVAYAVVLLAVGVVLDRVAAAAVLGSTPIGLSDTFGHARIVDEFERLLKKRGDSGPALTFVAATANHYAGNEARAGELYRKLPGSYPGVGANLDALAADRLPAVAPTPAQLAAALGNSGLQRWASIFAFDSIVEKAPAGLLAAASVAMFPLVMFLVVPAGERHAPASPARGLARSSLLLVPGAYDVRRGSTARALLLLICAATPLLACVMLAYRGSAAPAVGPFTATAVPNLEIAYPSPLPAGQSVSDHRLRLIFAYPNARAFYTFVLLLGCAGLALHVRRLPAILREHRGEGEETLISATHETSVR